MTIAYDVREFLADRGVEPSTRDITVMRFQRALQYRGLYEFDVRYPASINDQYQLVRPASGLRPALYTPIVPWDGSVHLTYRDRRNISQICDIAVPRSVRRFLDRQQVIDVFNALEKNYFEYIEQERKIKPFNDAFGHLLINNQQVCVGMSATVSENGRVHLQISGYFNFDEITALMKGVVDSHILDHHVVSKIMG